MQRFSPQAELNKLFFEKLHQIFPTIQFQYMKIVNALSSVLKALNSIKKWEIFYGLYSFG